MFWLLHGKTKTRAVPGGQTLDDRCPACGHWTTLHEVETTTAAGAFFVDVVSATDRGFRCSHCGEVADLVDTDDPPADAIPRAARLEPARAARPEPARATRPTETPLANPPPPRDLLAVLEAERADRIIAAAKRDLAVEDELAALKRKLGKK